MNRDRLISEAKGGGARPRAPTTCRPQPPAADPGRRRERAGGAEARASTWRGAAGRISDHDALIGRKLAWVLSGGDLAHRGAVSEQHLLDLEREAFLSLCGERQTQERIAHTLKTGKPLQELSADDATRGNAGRRSS